MRAHGPVFAALVAATLAAALRFEAVDAASSPATSPTTGPSAAHSTEPSDSIVSGRLQDPLNPQSLCYLNLETGQTFTRAELATLDPLEAHQKLVHSGVDLMCESREPVKGLVAYDMALHETTDSIEVPRELESVRRELAAIEPQRMEFITPGASGPRTFLFRTRGDQLGVLEIGLPVEGQTGVRLRYCLVVPPPRPVTPDILAAQLAFYRRVLGTISPPAQRQTPLVADLERRKELLEKLITISQVERDTAFAAIESQLAVKQDELQELKKHLPPDATQLLACQRKVDALQKSVDAKLKKMPQLKPMEPVMLLPVQPQAKASPATAPAGG